MKTLFFAFALFLSLWSSAQQISITGNANVQPGAQETYYAAYPYWDWNYSSGSWYVSGGTILYSNNSSCTVQWDNNNTTGYLYCYESLYGSEGSFAVQIGNPIPNIYPENASVNYGSSHTISVYFELTPSVPVAYQWQKLSATQNWEDVVGQTTANLELTDVTAMNKYRCLVNVNGTSYNNLQSEVNLTPLNAGTIQQTGLLNYNEAIAGVSAAEAGGGLCYPASRVYSWELSLANGPWTAIGGGAGFPTGVLLPGDVRIRRKVVCNGEEAYTNIVFITADYISGDFENRNYIREITVVKKGVRSWQEADALPVGQKFQTTTYADGLGRAIQSVDKEVSAAPNGAWNDLVKYYDFDAAGRLLKDFLPYPSGSTLGKFKVDAADQQKTIVQTLYGEPSTASTFSLAETDGSPLNRVTKMTPAGQGWAAASVFADVDFNLATEGVRIWNLEPFLGAVPTSPGVYDEGALTRQVFVDAKGKRTITYTDKGGKIILTKVQYSEQGTGLSNQHDGWVCTYNVYNDFGQLCFQLQPEAVSYLTTTPNWSFDGLQGERALQELCFQYGYDAKGRNTWKKAPGAELLTMLYDTRDRMVFTQDGNQRAKSPAEWTANLYDDLDRPVLSALYKTNASEDALRNNINNAPPVTINGTIGSTGAGVSLYQSPLTWAQLNNPAICTILSQQFYDTYTYAGVKPFDQNYTTPYTTGTNPEVEPIVVSSRTTGFATGGLVRVLGTETFLRSTTYYDDRGAVIQTNEDNIKSGSDVHTVQYQFDGRTLGTYAKHTAPGTGYTNFGVLTKNNFDRIGRVSSIEKKWGANPLITIAAYSYDEMGRLKTKRLHPGYTGTGKTELESLTYSYNIQNNITGINKDYALKAPATYSKWGHFFGLYLGYDNRDGVFAAANLNGQVTGLLWNTQGDDAQRKYDYTYDNAGRLTAAIFKEYTPPSGGAGGGWSNARMDFSVTGTGGKIGYDLNGNLLSMVQKGVTAGSNTPVVVDDLHYNYTPWSNKLLSVTDATPLPTSANGAAGDFKDGTNGVADDYVYDANGNVVIDLNKNAKDLAGVVGAAGIRYNFLDKPEEIRIAGKGTIKLVYDATGAKLQKVFTPEGTTSSVITSYAGSYVYQETVTAGTSAGLKLQFFGFEEGRVRVVQPVSENNGYDLVNIAGNMALPDGKQGSLDYYIRDYQQNVRMILTEETHLGSNQATMEAARAAGEEALFGQPGTGNELAATRYNTANIPGQSIGQGWNNPNLQSKVARLGALAASKVGPNALLKVMAGDEVSSMVEYYYKDPVTNTTGNNLLSPVVSSLISAIAGSPIASGDVKGSTANINSTLANPLSPFAGAIAPDANDNTSNLPKAYLNVLFFNERFEFVAEGSTALRVQGAGSGQAPLSLLQLQAPKNGYCFVYLSNESDEHVYFDNLRVTHDRKHIVEENHYYAYGLRIAAISSSKVGDAREGHLDNRYQYQGAFAEMDEDIGWNDFALRNYDAQIGRWVQQDPYQEYPSPYVGMGSDPVNNVDPDGGMTGGVGALWGSGIGFAAGTLAAKLSGEDWGSSFAWGALGAGLGAGIGYGLAQSAIDHTGFGNNFRAFYEGLLEDSKGYAFGGGTYAANPDIWGSIGALFSGVGNNMPNLVSVISNPLSVAAPEVIRNKIEAIAIHSRTSPTAILPNPTPPKPCRWVMSIQNINLPINMTDASPEGGSYNDPSLSDEQFNVAVRMRNRLRNQLQPGDRFVGTLTRTSQSNGGANFVPNTGGGGWNYNPATGRRIDNMAGVDLNTPVRTVGGVGNTIWQNFSAQTRAMGRIIRGAGANVNVNPQTVWGGPPGSIMYRLQGTIIRPPRITWSRVCD